LFFNRLTYSRGAARDLFQAVVGRGSSFSHSGSTSGGWGGFSHSGSSSYTGRFGNTYSTSRSFSGGYGGYHYGVMADIITAEDLLLGR
jgi:hypothetical protein